MKSLNAQSLSLLLLVCALQLSCGGGGGGGGAPAGGAPAASNFSGVAVDGYLFQARAFLDLNGNGQYDNGEPTAITDSNGAFTLSATQDQINSHSVVVSAIAGTTIDQDYPNTPLTSGMTLVAPAGNPSVVSPLTTHVSAKMADGLSLADAKSAVQRELGLTSIDVMKNYVAEKTTNAAYAEAHKVAVSVAVVLKTIESQSSSSTTLSAKLSASQAKVSEVVVPNLVSIKQASLLTSSSGSSSSGSSSSGSSSSGSSSAAEVVTNVIAQEVNIYSIGGSISGLTASGLVLTNGVGTVSPSAGANSFTFSSKKPSGGAYAVTVQSNPTGQICTVSNGSGTVGSQSITNVSVSCSNTPGALGGTISGLTTSGLKLKNGSDELTVASGSSTFQFSSTVADGATYSVTVKTQPTGKTCSVSSASGTMVSAGVTNITIACSTNSYSISGSISGLVTSGLRLKRGDDLLTVSSGASTFSFITPIAYGASYSVVVDAQPEGYTCSLSNSSATMGANNVTSVQVTCAVNSFSISGSISGLVSSGLKLKNGSDLLSVSSGTSTFSFNSQVAYGGSYSVTVDTQPTGLTCVATNFSGLVNAEVTGIQVTCGKVLDISVTGYFGTSSVHYMPYFSEAFNTTDTTLNLVVTDQDQSLTLTPASSIAKFNKSYALNSTYNISVSNSPDGYSCSAQGGSGTIGANTSSTVVVNCQPTSGTVVTIAGNSTTATTHPYRNGYGSTDANGWAAKFNRPWGIAVHPDGSLYVADSYNGVVRKIDTNGDVTTISSNFFSMPMGIIYHPDGYLLVSDQGNHRIYKIDSSNQVTVFAGLGLQGYVEGNSITNAKFNTPRGLAVLTNGDVLVADAGNHRIRLISSAGQVSTYAGSGVSYDFVNGGKTTVAMFNQPSGIVLDANENLYVSDSSNNAIRKITASTGQVSTFAGNINYCQMASESDCNGTGVSAGFYNPIGIAIDLDGNILVTDNNRVRKITPLGLVSTLAGGGGGNLSGFVDGPSAKAAFSRPIGLAVDTSGNIFVSDTYNHSIRKIKK